MPVNESFLREEVTYVTGLSLADALERSGGDTYERDTAQDAYNALPYFEEERGEYEVYEVRTTTRIRKVDPPYTKRS